VKWAVASFSRVIPRCWRGGGRIHVRLMHVALSIRAEG
jgi:hypothetical protein